MFASELCVKVSRLRSHNLIFYFFFFTNSSSLSQLLLFKGIAHLFITLSGRHKSICLSNFGTTDSQVF